MPANSLRSRARITCALGALLAAFCPLLARAAASLPALESGVVRHAIGIVPEPDGTVVAVGEQPADGSALPVVRLQAAGGIDRTFNASGLGLLSLDSIQRLPDGKFLVAGSFATAPGAAAARLVRLDADGSVDASFQPGEAFSPLPLVQSDGRILLLTPSQTSAGAVQPEIVRLHADGGPDTAFHAGVNLLAGGAYSLRPQADGKLLVACEDVAATGQPSLRRLNADGSLDRSFQVADPVADGAGVSALATTPDGKLLVAEYASEDDAVCTLSRLEPDGSPDPDFQPPAPLPGAVDQLAGDTAGRVLLAGEFTEVDGVPRRGFARLNADGSLDNTFDPIPGPAAHFAGFVATPGGTVTFARALTRAGSAGSPGTPGTLLERLGADGTAAEAVKIPACAACELVPAAAGREVYVQVEDRQDDGNATTAAAAIIAPIAPPPISPPPTPGGPIVNMLPFVTLHAARPKVFSGYSQNGRLEITRTGDLSHDLTVPYSVKGSAVAGRDYATLRGSRTIKAGRSSARIRVKPLDGYFPRVTPGGVSVKLELTTGPGYEVGYPPAARVRIVNQPPAQ